MSSSLKPEYSDLIESLEDIVRGEGDDTLNIPSFFERIMASIEANGIRFTETCYGRWHFHHYSNVYGY